MPKPILQAMVLADQVYQDRNTGKCIIAGTFSTIWFGIKQLTPAAEGEGRQIVKGPIVQMGSPYLYLALVGVRGTVNLDIKFVDLSDSTVLFEAQVQLGATDPIAVAEYILPMLPLPANKIGNYSLDILYEGEILGQWRVSMKSLDEAQSKPESES